MIRRWWSAVMITTLLVMLAVMHAQMRHAWRAETRCEAQMRELERVLDDALVVTTASASALERCRQRNRKAARGHDGVPAPLERDDATSR
jgi:hypothetical protein